MRRLFAEKQGERKTPNLLSIGTNILLALNNKDQTFIFRNFNFGYKLA